MDAKNTNNSNTQQSDLPLPAVTFSQTFIYWLKLGFISFGGPAGQIAIMHHYLVEKSAGFQKNASCMPSTIAWCCRARRRSS